MNRLNILPTRRFSPCLCVSVARTLSVFVAISVPLLAADWPQYLGPTRNGVYTGPPLNEKWPAGGPRVVWKKAVGAGLKTRPYRFPL